MKSLLQIVSAGLLVFVAVAVVQEWDYFSSAWLGVEPALVTPQGQDSEDAAVGAVREALALMVHFYGSGGDTRFAERMPVTPDLLEEFQADVDYLSTNNRIQDSRLQKLELRSVVPVGEDVVEVRTREFWIHRTLWNDGRGESDPPRSTILHTRYQLARENTGWRIFGREFQRPVAD